VSFSSAQGQSFETVLPGAGVVHFAQYPNRDHKTPPRTEPARTLRPDGTPVAIWMSTVPGHAPVHAIPIPRSAPPITFPSYRWNRFRFEGLRVLPGEMFVRLAMSMSNLLEEVRVERRKPMQKQWDTYALLALAVRNTFNMWKSVRRS